MPTFAKRRKLKPLWPAIFNATDDAFDTAATRKLWQTFFRDRTGAAKAALIELYAPLVLRLAARMKRRRPELYRDALDELIADGSFGLLVAIEANTHTDALARVRMIDEIRRAI